MEEPRRCGLNVGRFEAAFPGWRLGAPTGGFGFSACRLVSGRPSGHTVEAAALEELARLVEAEREDPAMKPSVELAALMLEFDDWEIHEQPGPVWIAIKRIPPSKVLQRTAYNLGDLRAKLINETAPSRNSASAGP
jgi:hypothetical protein